jgi:hypothetical protein
MAAVRNFEVMSDKSNALIFVLDGVTNTDGPLYCVNGISDGIAVVTSCNLSR